MNRLKDLREEKDLRQIDISKYLGMSQRNYSYYERGVAALTEEVLNKLADYYNTSVDYLICRTDNRTPYKQSILKETTKKQKENKY